MWKNLLLVPLSLLVALVVAEAVARIWIARPDPYPMEPGLMVKDVRGLWVPEPGYRGVMDNGVDFRAVPLRITKWGARRVPCAGRAAADAAQLFLIGDSQTFGFGLSDDETWANGLQCRLLAARAAVEVHNLGVPGINIDQYLRRATRVVAPAVRPGDIVIVGVTWNDLHTRQDRPGGGGATESGDGGGTDPALRRDAVRAALRPRLTDPVVHLRGPTWRYRLYRRTGIFVPSFASPSAFASSVVHASSLARYLEPKARLAYYRLRDRGTLFHKIGPETFDNNFLMLRAIADRLERRGARVIIVLLPNRLFFDDYYYESYSKGGRVFPARDFMMHLARPRCGRLRLDCVSMFAALATDVRDRYTFAFDGHYNARGAERIAAALARRILAPESRLSSE